MARTLKSVEHPAVDKYRDKDDDGCLVTLEECDAPEPEYGCARCQKSMTEYIRKLVKDKIPLPWKNNVWEKNGFRYQANGNATVAVFETTVPEAVFGGSWWFKHIQQLDPATWQETVKLYECPYAFALTQMMKVRPDRVLWAPEVNMILVYPNCMFQVIATAWHEMDEIRNMYTSDSDGEQAAGGVAARL